MPTRCSVSLDMGICSCEGEERVGRFVLDWVGLSQVGGAEFALWSQSSMLREACEACMVGKGSGLPDVLGG